MFYNFFQATQNVECGLKTHLIYFFPLIMCFNSLNHLALALTVFWVYGELAHQGEQVHNPVQGMKSDWKLTFKSSLASKIQPVVRFFLGIVFSLRRDDHDTTSIPQICWKWSSIMPVLKVGLHESHLWQWVRTTLLSWTSLISCQSQSSLYNRGFTSSWSHS